MSPSDLAREIAAFSAHNASSSVQVNQTQHRLDLVSKWPISEGQNILEIGCGQGDTTAVLAHLVGQSGHVTAVDPASLDYGSPFTLGQAQAHLSNGRLGSRITWVHSDPLAFLASNKDKSYDLVILSHCLWYFSSPSVIEETLRNLSAFTDSVCIAEWSLTGTGATAHVLAALTQAALECRKAISESNVRTVVSPMTIKKLAENAGLILETERVLIPSQSLEDGRWEVGHVVHQAFLEEISTVVQEDRERGVILAMRDAIQATIDTVGGLKEVRAMDVWAAVFSSTRK
ncbi:S-adenosyl-L-methionine-dependent methyltransferase [Mycena floridula]|nr:S-adenosyl-L-methionine-dependent methyltransferase [Mycena floridula]